MQEYLNLDEAAEQLGIPKNELSKMAQQRAIRAFADRGTWKFRKQDIEEHARQAAIGSGAEVDFGDADSELPTLDSGSSDQILLSDQALADAPSGSGKRVIGMDEFGRTPSDSDVRLVPEGAMKKGSDSDVKLVGGLKTPSDSDVKVVMTGEPSSTDSDVKLKGPTPGDSDVRLDRENAATETGIRISGAAAPTGTSDVTQDLPVLSEFEDDGLAIKNGSRVDQPTAGEAAEVGLDSDFELGGLPGATGTAGDSDMTLALDEHLGIMPEEVKLAPKRPSGSDVTAGSPSASGVNLSSPADSGIALDAAPPSAGRSGRGLGTNEAPAKPASDIFDTDFEVPAMDSDQEIAAPSSADTELLESDSEFALSDSDLQGEATELDSGSQVLSLEGEEQVDEAAATTMQDAPQEDQWEEELPAEGQTEFAEDSGMVPTPGRGMAMPDDSGAVAPAVVPVGAAESEWGGPWVGTLCFTTVVMLLLGMVMFDLVRTMWGWEGGTIFYQSPILNWLSSLVPKG